MYGGMAQLLERSRNGHDPRYNAGGFDELGEVHAPPALVQLRRSSEILPATAAVLGSLLFAAFLTWLVQVGGQVPSASRVMGVQLPNVVGSSLADAERQARALGLKLIVLGERPSEQYRRGLVVQQSPVPGWQFSTDGTLRVTVSAGLAVPDVRGVPLNQAMARLGPLGWRIGRIDTAAANRRELLQVTMQHPPPGSLVDAPGELSLALSE